MEHPNVLVFVEFPDPKFPTTGFLNNLAYPDVKLVGFYHLDEEESVQEAQTEYEEEFTAELQKQAEKFEERGVRTEYDLIFNHDRIEARQRVAQKDDIDAILIPGRAYTLGKVLIASSHAQNAEKKVTTLLNFVNRDDLIRVDLIHIADPDDPEGEDEGEKILKEVMSILKDEDIPPHQINREVRTGTDVAFELNKAARSYDLVVMGETQPDIGDKIFGPASEYIVEERDVPVLTIL